MVSVPPQANVISNYLNVRTWVKLNSQADLLTKYVPWSDWYPSRANIPSGTIQITYSLNAIPCKWYQIGDEVTLSFNFNILKDVSNNIIQFAGLPVSPINTIGMQNVVLVKETLSTGYLTGIASAQIDTNGFDTPVLKITTIGNMTGGVLYTIAGQVKYNVTV